MSNIRSILSEYKEIKEITEQLQKKNGPILLTGTMRKNRTHIASALYEAMNKSMLYVLPTDGECIFAESTFRELGINAVHFPAANRHLGRIDFASSGGTEFTRTEILSRISLGERMLILTSSEALEQKLPPYDQFISNILSFEVGGTMNLNQTTATLLAMGYSRKDFCDAKGMYSVRGGRLDIFPINSEQPVRIELFDDEIDTIRTYDRFSQRSIENINSVTIYPASELPVSDEIREKIISKLSKEKGAGELIEKVRDNECGDGITQLLTLAYDAPESLADYMKGCTVFVDNPTGVLESANTEYAFFSDTVESIVSTTPYMSFISDLQFDPIEAFDRLNHGETIYASAFDTEPMGITPAHTYNINVFPAQTYSGDILSLISDLRKMKKDRDTVILYAGDRAQELYQILFDNDLVVRFPKDESIEKGAVQISSMSMSEGMDYNDLRLVIFTETEIYGKTVKMKRTGSSSAGSEKRASSNTLLLSSLEVGDYVVHEQHGIARYCGIEQMESDGVKRDYLRLQYAGTDELFVPIEKIDRIQKYVGSEGTVPKLSRLKGTEWQKTINRVKSGVKALAIDLLKLYGDRMERKGYAFSPDTNLQKELEDSFPYVETPDQLTCIEEIKADMESDKIMDRLLCGDVGFGKTEVALRMAFKAAMDSKQVAFLAPTTVLVSQHYRTLTERFKGFPVKVEQISRLKSPAEQKEILQDLKDGKIDIIIGTHRLLSKDVEFKQLGLLIIDEEQRFGVGHKEIIKEMKRDVDVLTLTATPIPRTLHMSLIGIRDISVINTPPGQRYPVRTYVTEYTGKVIREAILRELGRGGQVYFLYNDVANMSFFENELSKLVPEAKICCAHGQMPKNELENTMLKFMEGEYNVLLSSTIIENGLDIKNANTIIVKDADRFGLSQLYQLKGRVGRGTRLGYAYFTFRKNKSLSEIATKRLQAIKEFATLGMGHMIAMRDLQIRGAGNLLGAEQHGHMEAVGYDMYRKLMSEAIAEARGETVEKPKKVLETAVYVSVDVYIPKLYIENDEARLAMYKRISQIKNREDLMDVQDELIDRFGDIPPSVDSLLHVALVKGVASELYITKVDITDDNILLYFTSDAPYNPQKMIEFVKSNKARMLNDISPTIVIPQKNTDKRKVLKQLVKSFDELKKCLDEE